MSDKIRLRAETSAHGALDRRFLLYRHGLTLAVITYQIYRGNLMGTQSQSQDVEHVSSAGNPRSSRQSQSSGSSSQATKNLDREAQTSPEQEKDKSEYSQHRSRAPSSSEEASSSERM